MTDETTIQPDTTTSPIDTPAADAPVEVATDVVVEAAEDAETSVLGGEAPAEAPEAEATPEVVGAPEAYELALEGTELDAETVAEAEPVLRELNLTNEQANKLLPVAAALVQKTTDRALQSLIEAGAVQRKNWLDTFKADPEIGGANEQETVHLAAKGLDALGFGKDHPFRQTLTETGFGNHPDMIRAMRKIGEMVGEDGLVRSDAGPKDQTPIWDRIYSNPKT